LSFSDGHQDPARTRDGTLVSLGWTERLEESFDPHRRQGLVAARVVSQHRGSYTVATDGGRLRAQPSGRLSFTAGDAGGMPAVGDWVAIADGGGGTGTIRAVLPRRGKFSRKVAGDETGEQVIAANVDVALVVTALNRDFNLRRIERYVAVAYGGGATPVVVLTKSDLCDDVEDKVAAVEAIAPGVPIFAVSNLTGDGIDDVRSYLRVGTTAVLLGSSGVGKSSLVNRLCDEVTQRVAEIRIDGKGRHTTTSRELVAVPNGGVIIDTPGMRELQLWDADEGVTTAFDDVESLAADCKFSDCKHEAEPGCAVKAAVDAGELDADRLRSYKKLLRELRSLEIRRDARAQAEERRRRMKFTRQVRAITKASPKSR
jgi:ribosome biogenesis GTPase